MCKVYSKFYEATENIEWEYLLQKEKYLKFTIAMVDKYFDYVITFTINGNLGIIERLRNELIKEEGYFKAEMIDQSTYRCRNKEYFKDFLSHLTNMCMDVGKEVKPGFHKKDEVKVVFLLLRLWGLLKRIITLMN